MSLKKRALRKAVEAAAATRQAQKALTQFKISCPVFTDSNNIRRINWALDLLHEAEIKIHTASGFVENIEERK